jgi:hypothetical protein
MQSQSNCPSYDRHSAYHLCEDVIGRPASTAADEDSQPRLEELQATRGRKASAEHLKLHSIAVQRQGEGPEVLTTGTAKEHILPLSAGPNVRPQLTTGSLN